MIKILVFVFLSFIVFTCSPTPFTTDVIMFDNKIYSTTNPSKIEIYYSRLDIPNKYYEIGTIKFTGDPVFQKIKEIGASKGADALIKDVENFIFIKFIRVILLKLRR